MKKISLLLFSILCLSACSDGEDTTPPEIAKNEAYPVHLSLNTNSGGSDAILSIGIELDKVITVPRVATDTLGYKGILMYSTKEGQLSAFDLACPYCWNGNILTATGDPNSSYECKVCGFYTFLRKGGGFFPDIKDHDPLGVDLVKYKVTKLDKGIYLVTNPSK